MTTTAYQSETTGTAAICIRAFLDAELAAETERKTSLQARGVTVITSSGAFVSLLVAVLSDSADRPPLGEQGLLVAALAALVLAALAAIWTNSPIGYQAAPPDELRRLVSADVFRLPATSVDRRLAELRVKEIAAARRQNGRKAGALLVAFGLEAVAIGLLGVLAHGLLSVPP